MLILARKPEQSFQIGNICVMKFLRFDRGEGFFGFEAEQSVKILRSELVKEGDELIISPHKGIRMQVYTENQRLRKENQELQERVKYLENQLEEAVVDRVGGEE